MLKSWHKYGKMLGAISMNKGLSEYDVYKVIRPLFGDVSYDQNNMPILNRADYSKINWDTLGIRGMQNMSVRNNNRNTLLTMFNYDKRLLSLWNSPLKKIPIFQTYAAVATPDFSLYPSMNYNEIRHNIFMSRWLGKTWQSYGCNVIPTVGWALPDTYDLCLGSIETGSVVIISTLGCSNYVNEFLKGNHSGFKQCKSSRVFPHSWKNIRHCKRWNS